QQILTSFGYTDPAADSASGFNTAQTYLRWIAATDHTPERWDRLNAGVPSALLFWYRASPRPLIPLRPDGEILREDPPFSVSGMTWAIVDSTGRLIEFQAVPPQFESAPGEPTTPNWRVLFDAARLDMSTFTPVTPQWSPRDFADTRAAWEG